MRRFRGRLGFGCRGFACRVVFPGLLGPLDCRLLPLQAFTADAVRGGRVESHLHELLQRHPFVVVINLTTPRTNSHELFQVLHPFHDPAGGGADNKPDGQHQQELEGGPLMDKREGMVREDQLRQLEQLIQIANQHDRKKAEVLIQNDSR